uniref:Uncharacterized protein n=1 Tax=uncultured bacterium contig00117 TaxID=1181578 RepID=A0A806JY81_9BACT|nr:hypothetical protein [uncultured bacterium contig00117]
MSEEEDKESVDELTFEEKMANLKAKALSDVIFCSIGWFIFWFGFQSRIGPMNGAILAFGGVLIGIWPLLGKFMQTRSWSALFFWRDYEVVTTYGDGRRSSDGGAQSGMIKLILYAILFFFIVFVLAILMPVRILFYVGKYTYYYVKVSPKPAFLTSAYPVLIFAVVWLVAAILLAQSIGGAYIDAQSEKLRIKDNAIVQAMVEDVKQQINNANNISYTVHTGVNVSVKYSRNSNISEVNIKENTYGYGDFREKIIPPGTYYFTGNAYTNFKGNSKPSQSEIEFVKKMIPENFLFTDFDKLKKDDLRASKTSEENDSRASLSINNGEYYYYVYNKNGKWEIDFYGGDSAASASDFRIN